MTTTVENLPQTLAAALHGVHQRPDNDGKWVKKVLKELQSEHPAAFSAFWKRLGLARELARLAGLSTVDSAALTLGLFFERVIDEQRGNSSDTPKAWLEYLQRNQGWLEPAIQVCELVRFQDHAESLAGAVVAVAANYDRKTQTEDVRPINALTALREEEMTEAESRVVELLWSEPGQAMCDRHFRAEEYAYLPGPSHVRDALAVLKDRSKPAAVGAVKRLLGEDAPPPRKQEPDRVEGATVESDNFERRKAQLRQPSPTRPTNVVDIRERARARAEQPCEYPIAEEQRTMEEEMNTMVHSYNDAAAIEQQVEDLRACLDQINRLSGNALGLLRALEPGVRRNAKVAGELSSMVQRFEDDLQRVSNAA